MKNSFENRVSQHFLFNSLNAVASLCRKNPEAAAELVIEISTYLQRSLEDKAPLITLDEELEHVSAYLNIQKARFAGRLNIRLNIEDNIQCLIPAFTLQPIIDNAIIHGVLKRKYGGTVSLSIKKLSHSVQVRVQDDGVGMTMEQVVSLFKGCSEHEHHSIGKINYTLKTVGFSNLDINAVLNEGTTVSFEIPFQPQHS
ncbi:sensor histidine kinase [Desulfosporosinus youngiae]|uniref:Putative regulator of cell autolysis n=1 Tax=Desulfosporosinus youngiae DSM 17734 TaxID=768710 RepID=H5XV74_9FIRM|nr:histidine kinase [Desulfosporosinus youngiae]EHQ89672.1 putative regulator of cell autolysis [Desulfosporosinus youngiae DSM 17734]